MKKKILPILITLVSCIPVGFILGFSLTYFVDVEMGFLNLYLIFILAFLFAMYFNVIVHEAGHMIFGMLTGYKFSSFRIAMFMLTKSDDGKMRLKLLHIPGTAGQCLMIPPKPENGRIPYALYNAGGWMMNLIFSLIFILIVVLARLQGPLGYFLLASAAIGIPVAATNGIPMKTALIANDGANSIAAKTDEGNMSLYRTLMLAYSQTRGLRTKDMDESYFKFPTENEVKNALISSEGVNYISRTMDLGLFGDAWDQNEFLLNNATDIPGLHRKLLLLNRLYLALIAGREKSYIESICDAELIKIMKSFGRSTFGIHAVYAYEKLYRGDLAKAEKLRKSFEKATQNYPYRGEIESTIALLDRVDEQWDFWNSGNNTAKAQII